MLSFPLFLKLLPSKVGAVMTMIQWNKNLVLRGAFSLGKDFRVLPMKSASVANGKIALECGGYARGKALR